MWPIKQRKKDKRMDEKKKRREKKKEKKGAPWQSEFIFVKVFILSISLYSECGFPRFNIIGTWAKS